ncbi:MAG: tetratricopeptide repeat protein [Ramlibacter sp.]
MVQRCVALLALCVPCLATATPFTPASDGEIVERLPAAGDPLLRRVEALRKQLAARPDDAALRLDIGRRYFQLAMAQGDPRYVGYAAATIAPLAATGSDNAAYWLLHGQIRQYGHDFTGALRSLERASELDPQSAEPIAWRAAIHMVQAQYGEALSECTKLVPLAHPLHAHGCAAYVQASTGNLAPAYDALQRALAGAADVSPELALWIRTRLAEMAIRLGRSDEADHHFTEGLKLGVADQFLLGAYADFLLAQRRPGEVLALLAGWERSDILLLRLALAGRAANDPRAAAWARQLRERFAAASQRGDRLHEQEAARFELDVEGRPAAALALATRNYQLQKEPRDAQVLMRAALAARQPQAAQPALEWLQSSGYEDPALAALAQQLAFNGAGR